MPQTQFNYPANPERLTVIVDDNNVSCMDNTLNALRVTDVGGGGGGGTTVVTDIEDGAGGSVMDPANDAIRVNIVAGGASTGQADKSAFVEGTTNFQPVGGVFNDTLAGDVPEDEAAAARITRRRAVHANLRNNDGTEVGTAAAPVRTDPTGTTPQPVTDNGGSLTVDGTVTANQGGAWTVDTELPAAAALSDAMPNPTTPSVGALQGNWNPEEDEWHRQRENTRAVLLTSAARTTDTESLSVPTYNFRRLALIVSVTANVGAINVTPRLQIQDEVSGTWVTIWSASQNLTALGTFAYYFADGASGGAWRQTVPFGIPGAAFRFQMGHNNGNSVTYSVSSHPMV